MPATPLSPERRPQSSAWALLTVAVVAAAAVFWIWAGEHIETHSLGATISVSDQSGQASGILAKTPIVVTLRWGNTGHRPSPSLPSAGDGTRWDGTLSLVCGHIEQLQPLAFEKDAQTTQALGGEPDELGKVIVAGAGEEQVSWRSSVQNGWDGLRLTIRACEGQVDEPAAFMKGSLLYIRTAQRSYTARLDWSSNDFVALRAEQPGQQLEVHITAAQRKERLRRSRVTSREVSLASTVGQVH